MDQKKKRRKKKRKEEPIVSIWNIPIIFVTMLEKSNDIYSTRKHVKKVNMTFVLRGVFVAVVLFIFVV